MKTLLITLILLSPIVMSVQTLNSERIVVPLEFYGKVDGTTILSNIDKMLSENTEGRISANDIDDGIQDESNGDKSLFKKDPKLFTDIASFHPELRAVWDNTLMVFGATADGIGIGTAFAVSKLDEHSAIFFTAYHVVEKFCEFPEKPFSEQISIGDNAFPCQSLYILNDIAIDTRTNQVATDGEHAWKSEIEEVLFFDKISDVAAFRIRIPDNNKITKIKLESDYEVDHPRFKDVNNKLKPLNQFDLYTIGYPSAYKKADKVPVHDPGLIRKRWSRGQYVRTKTFESESKLGFTHALKHSVYSLPGSSGGAMALPDGRVVGINFSMILNQYTKKRFGGCSKLARITEKELYAISNVNIKQFITLLPGDKQ